MSNISNKIQRWTRFLVGGGINTAITYGIYLILSLFINYQIAYLIAYVIGIIFAYWFNAVIVFKVPLSWKGAFSYPMVYIIQYIMSALFLGIFVEVWQINKIYAPLIVTVVMIPLTYFLSKRILIASS